MGEVMYNSEPLRFLSVCSGIEAASVAWNPLGWEAVAFSEIEKFPSAVLAHHYPDVPNLGDFTKINTTKLGRVDILSGGTPCQAFSVAGLRNSLADARGNLTLSFVRLVHELAGIAEAPLGSEHDSTVPATGERQQGNGLRNVVWENVPGVLSTKDNAFGCFLGALVGADGALPPPGGKRWPDAGMVSGPKGRAAWRVLDAQYFGLAQRRRRVILVADFGIGADPAAVLFELEGVPGNPTPSREARKDVAPTIAARTRGGGGLGTDFDLDGGLDEAATSHDVSHPLLAKGNDSLDSTLQSYAIQAGALRQNPSSGPDGVGVQPDIAYTIEARAEVQAVAYAPEVARCVATREGSSKDYETATMVAVGVDTTNGNIQGDIAGTLEAAQSKGNRGQGVIDAVCVTGSVTHTLKADGFDASEDGTGRGQPIVNAYRTAGDGAVYDEGRDVVAPLTTATDPNANIIAFDTTQVTSKTNRSNPKAGDPCHPLSSQAHAPAIAFSSKDFGADATEELSPTIRASGHTESHANAGAPPAVALKSAVRRLTPRECERLQGFPDDYTLIPWRGKPADQCPDGPRYKALGNSWAVPKFVWLGKRIARLMPSRKE